MKHVELQSATSNTHQAHPDIDGRNPWHIEYGYNGTLLVVLLMVLLYLG